MQVKAFGNKYVVCIDKGEEIVETLTKVCREQGITLGSITGIGAASAATLGAFSPETKKYYSKTITGEFEITSLVGNVSTMHGETYLHLHIQLADRELTTYGGHLNKAVIGGTGEIIIDAIDGEVDREYNEEIGLNLFKL